MDEEVFEELSDEDLIKALNQPTSALPTLVGSARKKRRMNSGSSQGQLTTYGEHDGLHDSHLLPGPDKFSQESESDSFLGDAKEKNELSSAEPWKSQGPNYESMGLESPSVKISNIIERQMLSIDTELEGLPSDAFSSPEPRNVENQYIGTGSSPLLPSPTISRQRLVAAHRGLRQTTLYGGHATQDETDLPQARKVHNYIVDLPPEPPTHHILDPENLKTWVYPMNLGAIRDYQYSIVKNGLFHNLLVALPTGLGKTFIAATIMLNYFRWTKTSQIVFVAPTKPLVAQQVEACFNVVGIPKSQTTMLTGGQIPALRAEEWSAKRVFFMTPQTLENDLVSGIADPKKIVLLVVDEAHRATGNYAYVRVVTFLRRFNKSFRVLALTATPGSSVEAVQEIIDNLEISKVEIRTEESMDIQQFVHRRDVDQILLDPSDEMTQIKDHLAKALQPLVNTLCAANAYWNRDPMALTTFGMVKARVAWMQSDAGRRANPGLKWTMNTLFAILASVAHGIKLLNFHGIYPFYSAIKDFRDSEEDSKKNPGKYRSQIINSPDFKKMMLLIESWLKKNDFIGHPKMASLCDTILNHFLDANEGRQGEDVPASTTRVIVFAEYRDSAEDIVRVLNRHGPLIRASVFVGQADSKRSDGMNQKQQLKAIQDFTSGTYNVIVATSIGEEGLDIGQVDLIVCYDSSASPIRMLQRMGRTGRKRAGRIVLLLMRGKEEESFTKAKNNYEQMQKLITSGKRFSFRHDLSVRILPRNVVPVVEKRVIELPLENTQNPGLPEPQRRPRVKKRPTKKFHMPDGVQTNFIKASNLDKGETSSTSNLRLNVTPRGSNKSQLVKIPTAKSVFLGPEEEEELQQKYQYIDGDDIQEVSMPGMTAQTVAQRSLRPICKISHGKFTERCVRLFKNLASFQNSEIYEHYQNPEREISLKGIDLPTLIDETKLRRKRHR
ncbi:putative atp-dependent dna helicase mph1 [Erysiphe necator]|uniref:ATP-dependent DNA helicase n=1 Tax=Uncinula necator TaxID=52586 RepID=A0A0B1PDM3_UNCNE|nr:putative atp-dependent dna helicase mph1 [Erysiphe necator]